MNYFLTEAAGMGSTVIMLLLMLGIFYFMLIRPESKRKKKDEEMRSSIRNGDEIITIGGICGTVVDVKEDRKEGLLALLGADQKEHVRSRSCSDRIRSSHLRTRHCSVQGL